MAVFRFLQPLANFFFFFYCNPICSGIKALKNVDDSFSYSIIQWQNPTVLAKCWGKTAPKNCSPFKKSPLDVSRDPCLCPKYGSTSWCRVCRKFWWRIFICVSINKKMYFQTGLCHASGSTRAALGTGNYQLTIIFYTKIYLNNHVIFFFFYDQITQNFTTLQNLLLQRPIVLVSPSS